MDGYRPKDSTKQHDLSELLGLHKCGECKKVYRSRMALNRHVREECGRILYTCPYCHNVMPMKFNLLNHLKKEHGSLHRNQAISQYMCSICGNMYVYHSSLQRHVREECGKPPKYQCLYCPKKSKLRYTCNTCLACSKTYKWKKSLHRHIRESPECWPVLLISGNGEFIRQIQYKMMYNTNKCRSPLLVLNQRSRTKAVSPKIQVAEYIFYTIVARRSEAVVVVFKKPFPCMYCERSYKNKSSLNRHLQYECGKEKQFICPICRRRLIQKSSLHKHLLAVHGI
nr:PREDICTED: zinc finger protein Xfin-like [Linepithema humile]